ncbi:methyltransferase domain-containing protein [Candidatus Nomurabacteria bacterium]|nr:methyltransferase domain-containing protein [Candidatus Nomurabacteria bacterium]
MFLKTDWSDYLHQIRKKEIDIIFSYFKKDFFNHGLEIGAGDGYQTQFLFTKCKSFISSDLNFERIKKENKKNDVKYIKLDADKMSDYFPADKFDFIFSSNVLEHLSNVDNFLKENYRILSDDGISVHIVPNRFMKFFYLLFFYLHIFSLSVDRFFGLFSGKKIFRGSGINLENNINSVKIKEKKLGKIKKLFLPQIHGNYHSHVEEWRSWGLKKWRNKFLAAGFIVEKEMKGPIFSGYGFGFNVLRAIFEKLGVSSEYIYVLRKKVDYKIKPKEIDELRVAIITAVSGGGYLTNTVIDGFLDLKNSGKNISIGIPDHYPVKMFDQHLSRFKEQDFINFSKTADLIFCAYTDGGLTDYKLLKKIDLYKNLIVLDGSETKGTGRSNFEVQKKIINLSYDKFGAIDNDLLKKCALYFRREKPYLNNIIPLPYGIERRYKVYDKNFKKDIDFVCIFGQEDFSPMRKYCREMLEDFCKKNNLICVTKKTKGFSFDSGKTVGRDEFYELLARAKVGISVSGGGYDTARFWETLANNCLLLTEKIDIFNPEDKKLDYKRIWEFGNLFDFQYQLEKISSYLKSEYNVESLSEEYQQILNKHSSRARVEEILSEVKKRGIL